MSDWIYGNADQGSHLYPDADDTLVANNIIDGNGEGAIFRGVGDQASSDNGTRTMSSRTYGSAGSSRRATPGPTCAAAPIRFVTTAYACHTRRLLQRAWWDYAEG